jgi:hypothetical protein
MPRAISLVILSDIHHACPAEQNRGDDFELAGVANPLLRLFLKFHHRFLWLHRQLHQNHLLDEFLKQAGPADLVIANGDYSCDTAFVGVSDAAACESARLALDRLRSRFGPKFRATFGDHELGKRGFLNGRGGMRIASFHTAQSELGLDPFWQLELGQYVLFGVVATLIALPVFQAETLPEEQAEWHRLREEHLAKIRAAFSALKAGQRVILFCHDPTALPFLAREPEVSAKISQVEQTIIGHLHSDFILSLSRVLAGMPTINFLGASVRRMSAALNEARHWKAFKVRLCPSLTGIELFKDGGFLTAELDPEGNFPAKFRLHRIKR